MISSNSTIEENNQKVMSEEKSSYGQELIFLDVGGTIFKTSQSTVCSQSGFFSAMLSSGSWKEGINKNETIFIDRDPEMFPFILSYLRSSSLILSRETTYETLKKLKLEADYYQLQGLIKDVDHKISILKKGPKYKIIPERYLRKYLHKNWIVVDYFDDPDTEYEFCKDSLALYRHNTDFTQKCCAHCGSKEVFHFRRCSEVYLICAPDK